MRPLRLLAAAVCALSLPACINSATLIKVNADGSGTVEQTTLVNMAAIKSMMPGTPGQDDNPIDEAALRQTAERMGKGVRLVSSEPMKADGFEGVKAVFAFDDINQVQVNQEPGMSGGGGMAPERKAEDPVRFTLTRQGGTSLLTVAFQDKPAGGAAPGAQPANGMPDMSDPMMMGMLKSIFQGFKVNIAVEVAGPIVETNAEYVSGSRVTLLEMDLGALLADEARFKELQGHLGPDASLTTVKPYLKDMKGIKLDGPTINIEFK